MKPSLKNYVLQTFEQLTIKLYADCVEQILKKKNYSSPDIDISNANLYITFLEKSLSSPFNRLNSLCKFVEDDSVMMIEPIYPFCYLKEKVRKQTNQKSRLVITIATGLNDADLDFLYDDFKQEERILEIC